MEDSDVRSAGGRQLRSKGNHGLPESLNISLVFLVFGETTVKFLGCSGAFSSTQIDLVSDFNS